ncbi:MAG: DUF4384 domain-containing protein [Hyphomicrobiaceae bacterium]|nr:DUF4384 domain-containing protein [Hyphomicrobiaceae bacterium]
MRIPTDVTGIVAARLALLALGLAGMSGVAWAEIAPPLPERANALLAPEAQPDGKNGAGDRPLADRVATILATHCGRCHQTGPAEIVGVPPGPDLRHLVGNPALVVAGNADASRLATVLDYPIAAHIEARENGPARWVFAPSASEIADLRAWIESLEVQGNASDREVDGSQGPVGGRSTNGIVSLWSDRTTYTVGSEVRIHVSVTEPCHLTVIAVDWRGQAVVVFPNDVRPDNRLEPGVVLTVPGPDDPFLLRFDSAGRERFVAICIPGDRRDPRGVRHDYVEQRFTILGPWERFLETARQPGLMPKRRRGSVSAAARRQRGKREVPDLFAPLGEARAAINVTVRP